MATRPCSACAMQMSSVIGVLLGRSLRLAVARPRCALRHATHREGTPTSSVADSVSLLTPTLEVMKPLPMLPATWVGCAPIPPAGSRVQAPWLTLSVAIPPASTV